MSQFALDRIAIHDTLVRGCRAIDTRTFDLFDKVFTTDAVIDYSPMWGPDGYAAFKKWSQAWAASASSQFMGWQHLLSNMTVEIDGDSALAITDFYNPLFALDRSVIHNYARYHDRLVRVADGWRIQHRKTEPMQPIDPSAS
jgi:hypothetical protein